MFEVVRELSWIKRIWGDRCSKLFKHALEAGKVDRNKTFENLHFQ